MADDQQLWFPIDSDGEPQKEQPDGRTDGQPSGRMDEQQQAAALQSSSVASAPTSPTSASSGATTAHPAPAHSTPTHLAPADIVDSRWDIPVISLDLDDANQQDHSNATANVDNGSDTAPGTDHNSSTGNSRTGASDGTTTLALDSTNWLDGKPTPVSAGTTPEADETAETIATPLVEAIPDGTIDAIADSANPAHARALKPNRRTPVIAACVAAALVAAGLAVGGGYAVNQRQTAAGLKLAQQNCQSAAGKFASAQSQLDTAIQNASTASGVTADQVADATTIDALKQTLQVAADLHGPAACTTTMSAGQLNQLVTSYNQAAELAQQQATAVANAAQRLANALDEARAKFQNSQYQVADDQTRVKLQAAIANAQELIDGNSTDTAAMDEATQRLATAIANVDESMQEAQRQAAASTSPSATATSTPRRTRRTTPTQPASPSTDTTNTESEGGDNGTDDKTDEEPKPSPSESPSEPVGNDTSNDPAPADSPTV